MVLEFESTRQVTNPTGQRQAPISSMETLVSEDYRADDHYHDPSHHGLAWVTIHEILHLIVFVYTLFGMIAFRVKFIHYQSVIKWIRRFLVAHNFYLSIKFLLVALLMFDYNTRLSKHGLNLSQFNCSLDNLDSLVTDEVRSPRNYSIVEVSYFRNEAHARNLTVWPDPGHLMPTLNQLLNSIGGPFKLLGHKATLMYGFYSIAIFIMLALFPLELAVWVEVGFNFIRFVLSDPGCMREFYERRRFHMNRLRNWSRHDPAGRSVKSRAARLALSKRDLTTNYRRYWDQLTASLRSVQRHGDEGSARCGARLELHESCKAAAAVANECVGATGFLRRLFRLGGPTPRRGEQAACGPLATSQTWATSGELGQATRTSCGLRPPGNRVEPQRAEMQVSLAHCAQMKAHLSRSHSDGPGYAVKVAYNNLERFKPFVRSDEWFKASMIIYTCFVFYYFITISLVIGLIHYYLETSLDDMHALCHKRLVPPASGGNLTLTGQTMNDQLKRNGDGGDDDDNQMMVNHFERKFSQLVEWTWSDKLFYYESTYSVLLISFASSFYTSYYFGTIIELTVWMREVQQQIVLSREVIKLNYCLKHPAQVDPEWRRRAQRLARLRQWQVDHRARHPPSEADRYVNDFGGFVEILPDYKARLKGFCGSLNLFWWNFITLRWWKVFTLPSMAWHSLVGCQRDGAVEIQRLRELKVVKFINRKETLLRALYVNMNLLMDELRATHWMSCTILRRTTMLSSGFAFLATSTYSQFSLSVWYTNFMLLCCFAVFNGYMVCAAYVNYYANKMLQQLNTLIAATIEATDDEMDMLDYWYRILDAFQERDDPFAYEIYTTKITWNIILEIDSFICTIYSLSSVD